MKIRIIERYNGKFEVQIKRRLAFDFFKTWVVYSEFDCLLEANKEMEAYKMRRSYDKQIEMLEKIKRVVKVQRI